MESRKDWVDWLIGGFLGLAAFVVYAWTLSAGAFPGPTAMYMAQAAAGFPRVSPSDPLWWGLVWVVRRVNVGEVTTRLNLLSAVFGALAVWWTYTFSFRMTRETIDVDETNRVRALIAARLAGVGSALALAFCVPFWIVSNRLHPAPFHILMLLVTAWMTLVYARTARLPILMAATFVYGLGVVEFATFIVLAPLFAVYYLYWLWRHEHLRVRAILGLALAGLTGLLLCALAAWAFYGSEGYDIRGYTSFFQIVWYAWRDQFFLIGRSLPKIGFLTVLFLTVVPWLVTLLVGKRGLNEEKDWSFYILHTILTVLAVAVILNAPVAPWAMLGFRHLLVTPYLLAALLTGYLIAYWFLLPSVWWTDVEQAPTRRRNVWRGLFAAALLGVVAAAPIRNAHAVDGRAAAAVNRYAEEIVRALPDGVNWLITDGVLDQHIRLAAAKARRPLNLLELRVAENPVMVSYVSRHFANPRLKNLLRIGVISLLQEWLESDAEAHRTIAMLVSPELWAESGFVEAPFRLVFLGAASTDRIQAADLLADHEAFWDRVVPAFRQAGCHKESLGGFESYAMRHLGLVANNLGVLLEDLDRPAEAFRAYTRAREMDPENVSALLNQWVLVGCGVGQGQKAAIQEAMTRLTKERRRSFDIRLLAFRYGYVRAPEAFAQLGWVWAQSGRPGMAVAGLKRALDLLKDGSKGELREMLAGMYLRQDQEEKSEALYYELLVENPNNRQALIGMGRIAGRQGNLKKAGEYLNKAEQAGADKTTIALEWAFLHLLGGNLDQARVAVQEIVNANPRNLYAWSLLIEMLARQRDDAGLQCSVQKLVEVPGSDRMILTAKAQLALLQNDLDQARNLFADLLASQPDNIYYLGRLLRLDMIRRRLVEAGTHARKLLALDPDHPFANYVLGTLQFERSELALAEDSFRKSLQKDRSVEALNDLAWLLTQRRDFEQAEKIVREILQKEENLSAAWDTQAVILMRTGRLDAAEKAFDRAMAIRKDDPQVLLHLAEFQLKKGNRARALELIEIVAERRTELPSAEQIALECLRREVLSPNGSP
ncbi:MAG: tetratricopeptide repeat protein [Verrucomicrobiota bacterium]|nr:tetratricopeptide repeat protein [Verrucomicrobiota bacterium]